MKVFINTLSGAVLSGLFFLFMITVLDDGSEVPFFIISILIGILIGMVYAIYKKIDR